MEAKLISGLPYDYMSQSRSQILSETQMSLSQLLKSSDGESWSLSLSLPAPLICWFGEQIPWTMLPITTACHQCWSMMAFQ